MIAFLISLVAMIGQAILTHLETHAREFSGLRIDLAPVRDAVMRPEDDTEQKEIT
jgi:hypothetical protein